jgi:hypothetical protein
MAFSILDSSMGGMPSSASPSSLRPVMAANRETLRFRGPDLHLGQLGTFSVLTVFEKKL